MSLFQQAKEQVQRLNPNRYSKRTDYWDEESGTNKLGMSDAEAFFFVGTSTQTTKHVEIQ